MTTRPLFARVDPAALIRVALACVLLGLLTTVARAQTPVGAALFGRVKSSNVDSVALTRGMGADERVLTGEAAQRMTDHLKALRMVQYTSGDHDAYQKGDKVTFEGGHYISLIDANVWSPAVYPQGWEYQGPA